MDQLRSAEVQYRIQHRHTNGEWSDLAPETRRHDPSTGDPERSWAQRMVFRCTHCDEVVSISQVRLEGDPE
jgi:hypothetical protein